MQALRLLVDHHHHRKVNGMDIPITDIKMSHHLDLLGLRPATLDDCLTFSNLTINFDSFALYGYYGSFWECPEKGLALSLALMIAGR
jgi:hypothetical protein